MKPYGFTDAIWKANKQCFVSSLVKSLANPFRRLIIIILQSLVVCEKHLYITIKLVLVILYLHKKNQYCIGSTKVVSLNHYTIMVDVK